MYGGEDPKSTPISKSEADAIFGRDYRTILDCGCGCSRLLRVGCDCECHDKDKRIHSLESALREIAGLTSYGVPVQSTWILVHEIAMKSLEEK